MNLEKERILCPECGDAETTEAKEKHDGQFFCHWCGIFFNREESPGKLVLDQEVDNRLGQFVAWLDDSLNGVRGEIKELDAGQDRDEVVDQLEWKTENMVEEAKEVMQELSFSKQNRKTEEN